MPRLLSDRYLAQDPHQAWDLATGEMVPLDARLEGNGGDELPLAPLTEVLDHGHEGLPRRIDMKVRAADAPALVRRAAASAQRRGFVPVHVAVYARVRDTLRDTLRDRALLLIAGPGDAPGASSALVEAAARSPRPHVLLILQTTRRDDGFAREARASYGHAARGPSGRTLLVDAETESQLRRAARADGFIREGRHAAAERLLRDVAGALLRRRRPAAASRVLVELGTAILERGRAGDAERIFAEAAAVAGDEEPLNADARIWQAVARTDLGRLAEAESICRAVLAVPSGDGGTRQRALATLARVLIWQRRPAEAAALQIDRIDEAPLDSAAASYVDATAVRALIADERLFDAGVRAQRLLSSAAGGDARTRAIAGTGYLRFLAAAGDLQQAAAKLSEIAACSREARAPLRAARARLIWVEALRRAGRRTEARHELGRLQRLCAAAPPLLQRAVDQALQSVDRVCAPRIAHAPATGHTSAALRLIALAHGEEDDALAVRRVLAWVAEATHTSRIDVCSADAGPVSTILSVGTGLPTRLGARVLEAGITLGPERMGSGHELGAPARRGGRLFGAVVGRWPADRIPPATAQGLLELACAVIGPRLEAMVSAARLSAAAASSVPALVGTSASMADVRTAIARAAAAPFAVLIQGESGVGKELVARAIHQLSPRRERSFCDINCAALPEDLLESELFGHARGAFTGAVSERAGLFEAADGGTLFLDELADLSSRAQAKLLRVLQQQEVRRVGETFSRPVDVRLVTAANREMGLEAENGRFRQDLLYRLDVIRIRVPPLRERPDDVAPLAEHYWQSAAARVGTTGVLTHGVLSALSRYHWPGNVRELQNVMAALAVAAPSRGAVRAHLLPAAITGAAAVTSARLADARAQFERRIIESALARAGGRRAAAARELGLSRQGLLKMMGRLGI